MRGEDGIILAVAATLAVICFGAGIICTLGQSLPDQLALSIIFGMINYVLVIVFCSEFFGPLEATLAAVYSIPLFTLLVPLILYQCWGTRIGGVFQRGSL